MTDTVSVPIDLYFTPLFIKKYNDKFSDSDFDGTAKFEIVISDDCNDNISDCLTSAGLLDSSTVVSDTEDMPLTLVEDNNSSYVMITNNVEMTIDSDVDVKGIFLRKKSNGFVIMAQVNSKAMRFCDGMTFEKDNILFIVNW